MNRYEIKYPVQSFLAVQAALSNFKMVPVFAQRNVHSIYFDSSTFTCFYESHEGIVPRKKIRLRWYDQQNFFLQGAWETKWSQPHHREKMIEKYHFDQAVTKKEILKMLPDKHLQPLLKVSYQRMYFQGINGVRGTWDHHITYQKIDHDLKVSGSLYDDSLQVFEIKADARIDKDILLSKVPLYPQRFSKYCRGLEQVGVLPCF